MLDQLLDELILYMIDVSDGINIASRLILVNKHLTRLVLKRIINTRDNNPACKILQISINKDKELVIEDIFMHYKPLDKINIIPCKEAFTNTLILCFLKNTIFKHNNIEISHSSNSISLYDSNKETEYIWGLYAHISTCSDYYGYYYSCFEYIKEWEMFDYLYEIAIVSRKNYKLRIEFDGRDCYSLYDVFSSIFPETSLAFWFPKTGDKKDEFYELLQADELPYPHPDTVTGFNAAKYRELYFAN
jgi:hypothetical protein